MYTNNDIAKIDRPKTLAELATLDATREVPYLKAFCNRIGIHVPGPDPKPGDILPHVQRQLAAHLKDPVRDAGPMSGDYMEWKLIREEYESFIAYLRSLTTPPLPTNPVNCVNPLPNPPSAARNESESKANQNRPDSEPHSQPSAAQPSSMNQKWHENEPNPDRTGTDSEPSAQKSSNHEENPQNDPPKIDGEAIAAQIDKLNFVQAAQYLIDNEILPDPDKVGVPEYGGAFLDLVGPPRSVRLDNLNPKVKFFILGLLEDCSLEKVRDKLLLPPPLGPYMATSKSALRRFRLREHAREAKRHQRSIQKQIAELNIDAQNPEAEFTAITEKFLKLRLVESSLNPDPDLAQTRILVEMLEKIHNGKLAERKVILAESK